MQKEERFLFLEILIVIGVIAFLASFFFVLNDPKDNFAASRNDRRWTDTALIMGAFLNYSESNGGEGVDDFPETIQVLGTDKEGCAYRCHVGNAVDECLDLSEALVNKYIDSIPFDPLYGSDNFTGYYINRLDDARVEVGACNAEVDAKVFVVK